MAELFRGVRIYMDANTGREVEQAICLRFDDVLDTGSSKGQRLPFKNQDPKTWVRLSHGREMWLVVAQSRFCKLWEAYLEDAPGWDYQFTQN